MTEQEIDAYLLNFADVQRDSSMIEDKVAYTYAPSGVGETALFALVDAGSKPLRVSLRCDPLLIRTLRDKYETVVTPQNLDKTRWNTVICSGQLSNDEIFDLARLSYRLVSEADSSL